MLAAMAAGTLAAKTEMAGKTLTPVAGERPQKIAAPFPNDMPTEVMAEAAKEITRVIGILGDALAALHEAGVPRVEVIRPIEDQKAIEAAADAAYKAKQAEREDQPVDIEAFKARLAEQQAEAQAAVYTQPVDTEDDPTVSDSAGWHCPTHGEAVVRLAKRVPPVPGRRVRRV
jgi:hypothetical protein